MILADTSVWIDYFNGVASKETDILDARLSDDNVLIGDIIFLEVLQGFRHDRDFSQAKKALALLGHIELFGQDMVVRCANNYRALRKRGITIRKTTDVIIATFCIDNQLPLLFTDRDFRPFVEHLKLREVTTET